ncbi:MAG: ACT domain-containing protein [Clostridiales bacterium]|nr:ACT domain-containing protein [Clostridiales bacterium]
MLGEYYIVSKDILPEVFHKVMEVKKMMESGEITKVSEGVKKAGISRSAYYKYKDHVFDAKGSTVLERKALISFVLSDEKGILSKVLNLISGFGCNILTINQNIPIRNKASVALSIDVNEMTLEMKQLLKELAAVTGVSKVMLVSVE